MRRVRALLAALLVLAVVSPTLPAAHAADGELQRLVEIYRATGVVDPCSASPAALRSALGELSPALEAYAPGLRDRLQRALDLRTTGSCTRAAQAAKRAETVQQAAPAPTATEAADPGPGQATPAVTTTTPQPPAVPQANAALADDAVRRASARTASDAGVPLVLWLLAALLLVGALAYLVARLVAANAEEGGRLDRSRHARSEAGWRASGAWADFTDWLRLGR